MHVCPASPAPRLESVGQHGNDLRVSLASKRAVRPRARQASEQLVFVPILACNLGDDLLRQHVERRDRHAQPIELAAPYRVKQRCAFDQIVARLGEQAPLRQPADRVARAPDALQECRDRAGRAELADEIDEPDVDAQFER